MDNNVHFIGHVYIKTYPEIGSQVRLHQKQTAISGHRFPEIKRLLLELRIKATLVGTTTFLTAEKRFSLHRQSLT